MQKQRFTVAINAPREKVWKTVLDDATYRKWTSAFSDGGSYYEGNWEKGSEIRFLGPDPETGKLGGMVARVLDNRPYEYVAIEHFGMVQDGQLDTTSEMVKQWTPAHETYRFTEKDGGTELVVETDIADDFVPMFAELWPKALDNVKALAEK